MQVRYHKSGAGYIRCVLKDCDVDIKNLNRGYLSELESSFNKKISLVVRDGSCGIPIIDDYKIFYNNEINELEVPTTVEEFYNGKKEIEESNRKLEYEKAYANLPLSAFGEYFRKRMPKVDRRISDRVSVECNVMKTGEIKDIEITKSMAPTADNALLKTLRDMGTWSGEPINDDVRVIIDIDYLKGEPRFLYVGVKKEDSPRNMYTDCYDITRQVLYIQTV